MYKRFVTHVNSSLQVNSFKWFLLLYDANYMIDCEIVKILQHSKTLLYCAKTNQKKNNKWSYV